MEHIVEFIVKQLVEQKDAVVVTSLEESPNIITIQVEVAKEDMGKVIGKGGKIAGAIRSIVKSASSNTNKKYFVKIGEGRA